MFAILQPEVSISLDSGVGIIAILLVTLWGAFGGAMGPYAEMNKIKQEILNYKITDKCTSQDWKYLSNRLFYDWLTMCIGTIGFLLIIAFLLVALPFYSKAWIQEQSRSVMVICIIASLLPAFGAMVSVASIVFPNSEFRIMKAFVRSCKPVEREQS